MSEYFVKICFVPAMSMAVCWTWGEYKLGSPTAVCIGKFQCTLGIILKITNKNRK